MKKLALVGIFISSVFAVCGQSAQDEIQKLKEIAKANEKLAMQNAEAARKAEMEVRVMRCLAIANELAERSLEIQEKELSALMAVQAYHFNTQYDGSSFNGKIYNSLFDALKKYGLIPKNLSGDAESKYFLENANNKPIFSTALLNSQRKVLAEPNGNLKFVNEQGATLMILSGHRAQVNQIQFSHSGKFMATSGMDNTIRIWNLSQLNKRPIVITESDQISKLAFSPDDTQILYALGVKKVTINQRPLDMKLMAGDLCNVLSRNFTVEEWRWYVADNLDYESTCTKK